MTKHLTRLAAPAALAVLAAVALAACGSSSKKSSSTSTPAASSGSSSSAASSSGARLSLSAVEKNGLSFSTKALTAKPGTVTLTMSNPSGNAQQHGVAIEGNGVDKDGQVVGPGGSSTVTVTLKPGTYTFYCPVPGHRQAGMQGKLTVQ